MGRSLLQEMQWEASAAFYPESKVQRCLHSTKQAPARLLQNLTQMDSPLSRDSHQDNSQVGLGEPMAAGASELLVWKAA